MPDASITVKPLCSEAVGLLSAPMVAAVRACDSVSEPPQLADVNRNALVGRRVLGVDLPDVGFDLGDGSRTAFEAVEDFLLDSREGRHVSLILMRCCFSISLRFSLKTGV